MVIDRFTWQSSPFFHCSVTYKRHVTVYCAVQYVCFDSFCPTTFCNSRSEDETITYYHLFPPTIGHRSWSLTLFGEFIYDSQNSVPAKHSIRWLQHQAQVHTRWFLERKLKVTFLCKEEPQGQHLTNNDPLRHTNQANMTKRFLVIQGKGTSGILVKNLKGKRD